MEPERWRRVEDLYHSALDRHQNDRAPFLERACEGDEDLRREVESLLSCNNQAADFIESPALQVAAQLLTKEEIEKEAAAESLPPGTTISHYRILEKIGAGGMGEVYRAHDPRLGRDVAIKILPAAFASDPDRMKRFEQEARAAAALNHPNIVAIYDVGTWQYGSPYVVSELLEGETLRACLQRGALPVRKAIDYASQVCLGLAAAHDKGIVHRDLKPENLWITKDSHVKILDFGLAKLMPEKVVVPELATLTESTSTRVMGTLGYMSPEQVRGQSLDHRTDIFSLGAVIYEMLAGRRAFQGTTPADTISAILSRDPAELTAANEAIPHVVSGIVSRALEKNADDRFHSARDIAFALAAASDSATKDAHKAPRTLAKPALASGAVILLFALLWLWNPRDIRELFGARSGNPRVQSLAVLPLENVSGNAEQDFFADGMTDELITELASLPDVRVISRSSGKRFRSSKQSLAEIARQLNVDAVVEGSVLRQGERVRITAQLVQASNDRHLWAHTYEGNVSDIIRLQNDIARSVTEGIKAKLRPEQEQKLAAQPLPVSAVAYDAYLHGLYFSGKLTPDDMQRSYDFFNKAIAADPQFAPAYAGLAESYSWAAGLQFLPSAEALSKAELAAGKALQLDPNLGMAHHAQAWVNYALKWDMAAAEKEFHRAIELSPNNSTVHLWYGMFLAQTNRSSESMAEMMKAKQLDPFSSIVNGLSMMPLLTSRQYDKLIAEAHQGLQTNPNDGLLGWFLTSAYEQKGDLAKAIDEQEKQAVSYGQDRQKAAQQFGALRHDLQKDGPRSYWMNRQKSLTASSDPYQFAVLQAHLGDADAMYASIEKAYKQRSTELLYNIEGEPAFDAYRPEPRFRRFLDEMGLIH